MIIAFFVFFLNEKQKYRNYLNYKKESFFYFLEIQGIYGSSCLFLTKNMVHSNLLIIFAHLCDIHLSNGWEKRKENYCYRLMKKIHMIDIT